MSSTFFGLTSPSEIRAQLGAGTEEFDNQYIEDLGLESELQLDLLSWFPSYQSLVDDFSSDTAIVSQTLALKAYSKAYCALAAVPTVRMRFVQKKADGDNQAHRFQNKDTINHLQQDLMLKVSELRTLVLSYNTAFTPTEAEEEYAILGASVASPNTDKIVG